MMKLPEIRFAELMYEEDFHPVTSQHPSAFTFVFWQGHAFGTGFFNAFYKNHERPMLPCAWRPHKTLICTIKSP